ncbi:MAG: biotin carboxylase, partial [Saprospiraceae bacterium]
DIPIHYDPMISKLIVHAPSRIEAIEKMSSAIDAYQVHGVETTLAFGKFAINHPDFITGNFDTHFVDHHMAEFISAQKESNFLLARFVQWLDQKRSAQLVLPEMGE